MRDKRVYVPPACKAIDVAVEASGREHRAHLAAAWRYAFGIGDAEYRKLCMPTTVVAPVGDTRKIRPPTKRAALKCGYGITRTVVYATNKARVTHATQGSSEGKAGKEVADTAKRKPKPGEQDNHPKRRAKAAPAKRMQEGGKAAKRSGIG